VRRAATCVGVLSTLGRAGHLTVGVSSSRLAARTVTLLDQVLSSVSNVLAVLLVARALHPADFGRFALGYAVLTLALTLSRAYFGTRVSLAPDRATARRLTAAIAAGLLMLSPVLVLVVLGLSVLTAGNQSMGLFLIIAFASPVVLVQDIVRAGSAASGEPGAALLSDGVWVAVMAAPFALRLHLGPTAALALWGLAALAALVVALGTYRLRPRSARESLSYAGETRWASPWPSEPSWSTSASWPCSRWWRAGWVRQAREACAVPPRPWDRSMSSSASPDWV
jgi:hypothetical protein